MSEADCSMVTLVLAGALYAEAHGGTLAEGVERVRWAVEALAQAQAETQAAGAEASGALDTGAAIRRAVRLLGGPGGSVG